jgi:glycosyltransferase involved in cell wall biosynthesis
MQLSVIILNYNVRYFLEQCVLSVQKALEGIDGEIIVIDNAEGYTYYLSSDAKRYYQTTDAKKIAGCETATISVTCHGGTKLGEASTQYKCSSCGGSVNGHTKQCAMATSVTHESVNTSEIDSKIAETERKMASLQSEITNLEAENSELLRKIKNSNVNDAARYRQQYNANKDRITALKSDKSTANQNLPSTKRQSKRLLMEKMQ